MTASDLLRLADAPYAEDSLACYRRMVLIRRFEELVAELRRDAAERQHASHLVDARHERHRTDGLFRRGFGCLHDGLSEVQGDVNLGARVGFLVAVAGLFGWMTIMSIIWTVYGIGFTGTPTEKAARHARVRGKTSRKARAMKIPAKLRHLRHTHNQSYSDLRLEVGLP